jgi:hypothetical protein
MEIPDAMIDRQAENMIQEFAYRLSYQGLKFEDYLKYTGKTVEDMKKDYKEQAEGIVKTQLVIDKIIQDEKIDATEEVFALIAAGNSGLELTVDITIKNTQNMNQTFKYTCSKETLENYANAVATTGGSYMLTFSISGLSRFEEGTTVISAPTITSVNTKVADHGAQKTFVK